MKNTRYLRWRGHIFQPPVYVLDGFASHQMRVPSLYDTLSDLDPVEVGSPNPLGDWNKRTDQYVLDALEVPGVGIGHSDGATALWRAAYSLQYSENLKGLVLISPGPFKRPPVCRPDIPVLLLHTKGEIWPIKRAVKKYRAHLDKWCDHFTYYCAENPGAWFPHLLGAEPHKDIIEKWLVETFPDDYWKLPFRKAPGTGI